MTMNKNQMDSYAEIYDSLNDRRKVVYKLVKEHPDCTYNDLCRITGKNSNDITGRLRELIDLGHVIITGDKEDPITHKMNATHRITLGNEGMEVRSVTMRSLRMFTEDIDAMAFALEGIVSKEMWNTRNNEYFISRTMYSITLSGKDMTFRITTTPNNTVMKKVDNIKVSSDGSYVTISNALTEVTLKVAGHGL